MEKFSKHKMIKSGRKIEFYEYEREILKQPSIPRGGKRSAGKKMSTEEERAEMRTRNQKNARHNVIRLVDTNFGNENTKFVTLTFRKNIQDVTVANAEFTKFIKRMRRIFGDFKYVATIEFQDKNNRGAVHYHMILNVGYIPNKKLRRIWGKGWVRINKVKDAHHAACYAGKYMGKNPGDKRLMGRKSYFTSRNLVRPEVYSGSGALARYQAIASMAKKHYWKSSYNSEFCGKIDYKVFYLDQDVDFDSIVQAENDRRLECNPELLRDLDFVLNRRASTATTAPAVEVAEEVPDSEIFLQSDSQFTAQKVDLTPLVYNSDLSPARNTAVNTSEPVAKTVPVAEVVAEEPRFVQETLFQDFSDGAVLKKQDAEHPQKRSRRKKPRVY